MAAASAPPSGDGRDHFFYAQVTSGLRVIEGIARLRGLLHLKQNMENTQLRLQNAVLSFISLCYVIPAGAQHPRQVLGPGLGPLPHRLPRQGAGEGRQRLRHSTGRLGTGEAAAD